VNQGGEPGQNDDGLPRVDIEIPDDARELYRDVQAYHRELRALRRNQRSRRLGAPLRRTGVILPLAAGCLILALVSGMVLTVFSADPYFSGFGGQARSSAGQHKSRPGAGSGSPAAKVSASSPSSARPTSAAPAQTTADRLPGTTISVAGRPLALGKLTSTALAIVPADCGCTAAVRQLLAQASQARVAVYLVGPRGNRVELARLAALAGPSAMLATDARNVLSSAYQPAGLTVLLVDAHGSVMVAYRLLPGLNLESRLRGLRPAG
jgi:hypothetical protein